MSKLKVVFYYIKQILLHKKYVFQECKKCGIIWQGITHDLSKFSKEELIPSAKYYDYYNVERNDKIIKDYSKAWMHHKGHNPHHWEYWIDYDENGNIVANKIPYNYVIEMVCDWIGAGKAYEKRWNTDSPFNYYNKVRNGRHFHPETEKLVLLFLNCIRFHGLKQFHKLAKGEIDNGSVKKKYEGICYQNMEK